MDKLESGPETKKVQNAFGFSYVNLGDGKPSQIKFNGLPTDNPIRMFLALDDIIRDAKISYYRDFADKIMKKHNLEMPQQESELEPPVGEKVNEDVTDTQEHIEGDK